MFRASLVFLVLFAGSEIRVGEPLPKDIEKLLQKSELRGRTVLVCTDGCDELRPRLEKADIAVVAVPKSVGTGGVLIEDGIVRRVVGSADKVRDEVLAWRKGQGPYQDLCARCHGADGADTSYSGIKPLAGLGRRISETEIARRTGMTGTVDLSHLSDDDRRALASYVAGL